MSDCSQPYGRRAVTNNCCSSAADESPRVTLAWGGLGRTGYEPPGGELVESECEAQYIRRGYRMAPVSPRPSEACLAGQLGADVRFVLAGVTLYSLPPPSPTSQVAGRFVRRLDR